MFSDISIAFLSMSSLGLLPLGSLRVWLIPSFNYPYSVAFWSFLSLLGLLLSQILSTHCPLSLETLHLDTCRSHCLTFFRRVTHSPWPPLWLDWNGFSPQTTHPCPCFIFLHSIHHHLVHYIHFTCALFIILQPPLEGKVHESRNVCPFCSLLNLLTCWIVGCKL